MSREDEPIISNLGNPNKSQSARDIHEAMLKGNQHLADKTADKAASPKSTDEVIVQPANKTHYTRDE